MNLFDGPRRAGVATVLFVAAAHVLIAQEWVNGAKNPERIPDSEAYQMLFLVMRSAPPPHWDFETKINYLKPAGFQPHEVHQLVLAADRFVARSRPVEDQIKAVNQKYGRDVLNPVAVAEIRSLAEQRRRIVLDVVAELAPVLGSGGITRLQSHLDRVKRGMRTYIAP